MKYLLLSVLVTMACVPGQGLNVTIGMIWSRSSAWNPLSYQRTASAFTIAREHAESDGVLTDIHITNCRILENTHVCHFVYPVGAPSAKQEICSYGVPPVQHVAFPCVSQTLKLIDKGLEKIKIYFAENAVEAMGRVVEMVLVDKVDLVFGHPSSRTNIPVSYMTSRYNIPHVSWSSVDVLLSDKALFKTLIRTSPTSNKVGAAIGQLLFEFGWHRVGIFGEDLGICLYSINSIVLSLKLTHVSISSYTEYHPGTLTDEGIVKYLNRLKGTARIVAVCSVTSFRKIMLFAYQLGMCNGEYVFIDVYSVTPIDKTYTPWQVGDSDDAKAKMAYKHALKITKAHWVDETSRLWLDHLETDVPLRMHDLPWNNTEATDNGYVGSHLVAEVYYASYLWFLWLNHSKDHHGDHMDGAAMFKFTENLTFSGPDGFIHFDDNGDREPAFWILDWKNSTGVSRVLATIDIKTDKVFTQWTDPLWRTSDGLPPLAIPVCGFDGSGCPPEPYDAIPVVCGIIIPIVVLGVAAGVIWTYYRKKIYESELRKMRWKIDFKDIYIHKSANGPGSRFSRLSLASITTNHDTIFTSTGKYQGNVVAIRKCRSHVVKLDRQDHVELQAMKEMTHDNLNAFIGASIDLPNVCALFQYCSKGSLQDILQNDDIKLDWTFKMSLISDCLEGLTYLSGSALKSFGRLKSSNCLVDNRWILKLTDYGVHAFTCANVDQEIYQEEKYKALLWMAPELLRAQVQPRNGTQTGDIYAFGILLHEIYYRMGVFSMTTLNAKDIVSKVKAGGARVCRPLTDARDGSGEKPALVDLMQLCWSEDTADRPPYATIRNIVKTLQGGKKVGILDNMIGMLEKYANNLEDIVGQRTEELLEEKQKTDTLLYRMLPKTVAEKLKLGKIVDPEAYEAVTIFFSDIVGFTRISATTGPMQIVDLLNDLYTLFDDIIAQFDVYKVETIGDAYMVVGGLSRKGDNQHAEQIADMSLTILSSTLSFKIRHMPNEKLRVRIGLHSGACCAGVVGLTMPRYCLFGDTVNTASRMESNGEAQKIHISDVTKAALDTLGVYYITLRGELTIKGKGSMTTYWLSGKSGFDKPYPTTD